MTKGYKYLVTALAYMLVGVAIRTLIYNEPLTGKFIVYIVVQAVVFTVGYHLIAGYILKNNQKNI